MQRKIALITGATSGIGEACARKFASGGYDLVITGRNVDKMKAVEAAARELGADVLPLVFDVRDRKAATAAVESLTGKWATVDVLINNAGLALGLEKEYEGDMDDWETMIDTNIKGLLTMTRLIVPGMWSATGDMLSTSARWPAMRLMPEETFTAPQRRR